MIDPNTGKIKPEETPATSTGPHTHPISEVTGLQAALDSKAASSHAHAIADVTNLQTSLNGKQDKTEKGVANGYASLGADGKVPSAQLPASGSDPFMFKGVLASDVSTGANVTPVNVTGMVFTFEANSTYVVEVFGILQSPAATTGCGMQFDVSAAVTLSTFNFFHQLANTGTLTGGSSIADDASVGVSSGVPTANTNVPLYGSGVIKTGANTGTAQLRLRSETTAITTLKAGSVMRVHKVA